MVEKLKFGISLGEPRSAPFRLRAMTKCSTMNNGMNPKSNTRIWDEVVVYAKAAWEHAIKQIKVRSSFVAPRLQGIDQTGGTGNVLCRRHNLHVEWKWKMQT